MSRPWIQQRDSERSEEYIFYNDVCFFFFVSVYSITSRNNDPISNYGCGFRCKSEYPWCIIEVKSKHFPTVIKKIEKNKKKNDGKTGTSFRPNRFFVYGCNSKTNHCKYLKFHHIPQKFSILMRIFFEVSIKKFWMANKT
ncbi:Uncharacterized protein FWK35_00035847, partial [Aphis craccivora]